MFDLIHEISQSLSHNKLRTALTGVAVAWGVFMLIILLAMSRGVAQQTKRHFDSGRSTVIQVWGGTTYKSYKGYQPGRHIALRDGDGEDIESKVSDHVESVLSVARIDTSVISYGSANIAQALYGTEPRTATTDRIETTHGRFLSDNDLEHNRRVVVLSAENAEVLFGDPDKAVGKNVSILGLAWQVVGVYSSSWQRDAFVPYSTLQKLKGSSVELEHMMVSMKDISSKEEAEATEAGVRNTLARRHTFDATDNSAVYTWNSFTSYIQQLKIQSILNAVVWIIGLFSLLSGIVGVSNIMFVSVRERTHEIGIRRAIGAKPRSVLVQIIAESVAITTLFGLTGVVFGTFVLELIKTVMHDDMLNGVAVDLPIALSVTAVLIVVGAIAGIFPARRATKISPVEALRDE